MELRLDERRDADETAARAQRDELERLQHRRDELAATLSHHEEAGPGRDRLAAARAEVERLRDARWELRAELARARYRREALRGRARHDLTGSAHRLFLGICVVAGFPVGLTFTQVLGDPGLAALGVVALWAVVGFLRR